MYLKQNHTKDYAIVTIKESKFYHLHGILMTSTNMHQNIYK